MIFQYLAMKFCQAVWRLISVFMLVFLSCAATISAQEQYMIFFEYEESFLTPEAEKVVDVAASRLLKNSAIRAEVIGHDDTSLPSDLNFALSYRRAKEVAAALVRRGIDFNRIYIAAVGSDRPLVPTERGVIEAQNRNVEIRMASQSSPVSLKTLRVYKP